MTKGSKSYLKQEKRKHLYYGLGFIAAFLCIYISGILLTGTNKNYGTIMAVLTALPAAQMLSKYFALRPYPSNNSLLDTVKEAEFNLYNLLIVFDKKVYFLDVVHIGSSVLTIMLGNHPKLKQERSRVKLALKTLFKHKGQQVTLVFCDSLDAFNEQTTMTDCESNDDALKKAMRQTLLRNSL